MCRTGLNLPSWPPSLPRGSLLRFQVGELPANPETRTSVRISTSVYRLADELPCKLRHATSGDEPLVIRVDDVPLVFGRHFEQSVPGLSAPIANTVLFGYIFHHRHRVFLVFSVGYFYQCTLLYPHLITRGNLVNPLIFPLTSVETFAILTT